MFVIGLFAVFCVVSEANCYGNPPKKQYFDTFEGTPINNEQLKQLDKKNATFWCAIEVDRCDPHEGRRLDGSCNNLEHPTRGAAHTPFYRVLPANFFGVQEPRKAKCGEPLPLARSTRTAALAEGRVPNRLFTQLFTHYIVYMSSDVAAVHDTVNYIVWKPYCCTPKGLTDDDCTPNKVPDDDPVHRFSNVRCLNMTRPISFQTFGCLPNGTTPERINTATPLFDMSTLYGSIKNASLTKGRKYEGGLLKYEVDEKGRVWPPSTKGPANLCLLNQKPRESRCHDTPDDGTNSLFGINLISIWFWRLHNLIATKLAQLNPCWNDERLFYTARDINIAIANQIYYYEMLPDFLGRDNLILSNVISSSPGFRDLYNENIVPQVSLEYPFVLRWLHTMQEGRLKMYDLEGNYLKQFPIVNLTLRTGYLAVDDNIDYITQGSFRQPCAGNDYIVDPDISEIGLGPHQHSSDILTNDLSKNRYFGFQPYIKYREFCFGRPYRSFHDLADVIDPERLEILKELYNSVEDIDLLAGIWLERYIGGGFAPSTFYCLVVDQLIRAMVSDRHWYERPNRPNAFTFEQLLEIRKMTIASVVCEVGDKVKRIQPKAFLRAGPTNPMLNCYEIPKIDLTKWKDATCRNRI